MIHFRDQPRRVMWGRIRGGHRENTKRKKHRVCIYRIDLKRQLFGCSCSIWPSENNTGSYVHPLLGYSTHRLVYLLRYPVTWVEGEVKWDGQRQTVTRPKETQQQKEKTKKTTQKRKRWIVKKHLFVRRVKTTPMPPKLFTPPCLLLYKSRTPSVVAAPWKNKTKK